MTEVNPYSAPEAEVSQDEAILPLHLKMASGQKLIIYSILLNFAAGALQLIEPSIGVIVGLITLAMIVVGLHRLFSSFGTHTFLRVLGYASMILPLINIIILIVLSIKATKKLRAVGIEVGLLGAKNL